MRSTHRGLGLVWVTLLAGAAIYLRLWKLGTHPGFSGDEGRILLIAQAIGRGDWGATAELPSWIGPWLPWLTSPLTLLAEASPGMARLIPALLSLATVPLAYLLGRRWAGPQLGLIAAALFAFGALWISWARIANSVSLVPCAVLACLLLSERLVRTPTPLIGACLGAAIGFTISLHLSAVILLPALACIHLNRASLREVGGQPKVTIVFCLFLATFASPVLLSLPSLFGVSGELVARTQVDIHNPTGPVEGLLATLSGFAAALTGGQSLEGFGGRPSGMLSLHRLGGICSLALLAIGPAQALRLRDRLSIRLLLAVVVCLGILWLGSSHLDLRVVHRERYLFVPLVLATLLSARGLSLFGQNARAGSPHRVQLLALSLLVILQVAALEVDWRRPLDTGGGSQSKIWWVGEDGEPHKSAANWLNSRLLPGEQGLLLCSDYWSLYPVLPFLDRKPLEAGRLAFDYIHEPQDLLVSELKRTAHRRRFLIDHADGAWEPRIRSALHSLESAQQAPALEIETPDGRPIIRVWELPPAPASR